MSISVEDYWDRFVIYNDEYEEARHSAWAFGGGPGAEDRLLALVLAKLKTATSGLYDCYVADGEPIPAEGDCSIILNSDGAPECIIVTRKVTILPYDQVDAEFAEKEGEGDQSLKYWRRVHEKFFTEECARCGLEFSTDMKVVCEEFEMVFR